jgi:hypothetical protein
MEMLTTNRHELTRIAKSKEQTRLGFTEGNEAKWSVGVSFPRVRSQRLAPNAFGLEHFDGVAVFAVRRTVIIDKFHHIATPEPVFGDVASSPQDEWSRRDASDIDG